MLGTASTRGVLMGASGADSIMALLSIGVESMHGGPMTAE